MAKMTVEDAKAYLKTEVGYSDEQISGLNADQLKKLADGVMRQAEFDRVLGEERAKLQAAQAKVEEADKRLNAEMAEWGTLRSTDEQRVKKLQDDFEAAQLRVTQLQQRVTRIATDAGLDPAKALEGIDQQPVKPAAAAAPDLTGYVKADDINRELGNLANMAVSLPAELFALATEHQELFGKPLDTRPIVKEMQSRAATKGNSKSLNPREIWEESHKVSERRDAIAKERYDADIKAAEERGRVAALSEQQLPGSTSTPGKHAPLFTQARESVLKRPQPGTTAQNAAAAFRTGKYREGAGKTA